MVFQARKFDGEKYPPRAENKLPFWFVGVVVDVVVVPKLSCHL